MNALSGLMKSDHGSKTQSSNPSLSINPAEPEPLHSDEEEEKQENSLFKQKYHSSNRSA